jgi:hypothetical protein
MRSPRLVWTVLLLALGTAAPPLGAQLAAPRADPAAPSPVPAPGGSLADLAWVAGTWSGEMNGSTIEEQWSAPAGGAMMGMFRWVKGGTVLIYEFLLFEVGPAGVTLRLRHFEPGLIGWEEKDAPLLLPQVAAGPGEAAFEGGEPGKPLKLIYRRTGDRTMTVVLERQEGGAKKVQEFLYQRR